MCGRGGMLRKGKLIMSRNRGGDCCEAAAHLLIEKIGPKGLLVHGIVWGEGVGWHGHAWCEVSGVAWDRSNGRDVKLPIQAYRALGKVREAREYSFDQACQLLIEEGHYGPWDPDILKQW